MNNHVEKYIRRVQKGPQHRSTHCNWGVPPSQHVNINITPGKVAQSCPTLCDPMDCSPPGSSFCGIFQARILEWVAISFCRYETE